MKIRKNFSNDDNKELRWYTIAKCEKLPLERVLELQKGIEDKK